MSLKLTANQAAVINTVENNIQNALSTGVIDNLSNDVISAVQNYNYINTSLISSVKRPFKSAVAAFLSSFESVISIGGSISISSINGDGTTTGLITTAAFGAAVGMIISISGVTGVTGWNGNSYTVVSVTQIPDYTLITFSSSVNGMGDASTGTVTTSSFSNSWVNLGTTNYGAGFYKNQLGEVKLRGAISSGTVGSVAFSLPAGYQPSKTMVFPVISNNTIGAVQIDNSGNVTPIAPSNNTSVFLDGINFRADQ